MSLFLHELKAEQRLYWRSRKRRSSRSSSPCCSTCWSARSTPARSTGSRQDACCSPAARLRGRDDDLRRDRDLPRRAPRERRAQAAARDASSAAGLHRGAARLDAARLRARGGRDDPPRARRLSRRYSGPARVARASLLLGAAAFTALGIALTAAIRSAEGASAIVNMIVLPMAFLSGAFGPTRHYPHVLRAIADVLPLTYLIRLVRGAIVFDRPIWDTRPRSASSRAGGCSASCSPSCTFAGSRASTVSPLRVRGRRQAWSIPPSLLRRTCTTSPQSRSGSTSACWRDARRRRPRSTIWPRCC